MTWQQKERKKALDRYYSDPNRCVHCGKVIQVRDYEGANETRRRKFCNKSCAASHNNKGIKRNSVLKIKTERPFLENRRDRWTKNISQEEFLSVAQSSSSIKEILEKFGQSSSRHNYSWVRKSLLEAQIDTSRWYARHTEGKRLTLEEILVENSDYPSGALKRRLMQNHLLENKCQICGMDPEWNGLGLVLVMDHINGINTDHRIENLRLVCPNCDSQLPTYKSRNKRINKRTNENKRE